MAASRQRRARATDRNAPGSAIGAVKLLRRQIDRVLRGLEAGNEVGRQRDQFFRPLQRRPKDGGAGNRFGEPGIFEPVR